MSSVCFNRSCADVEQIIFSHLLTGYPEADKALLETAAVSKSLLNNPQLAAARPEARQRMRQYGQVIKGRTFSLEHEKAFRKSGFPLENFPALKLPEEVSDYISIKPDQMSHPIMIFRDSRGRDGVAILMQQKGHPEIKSVLTLHRRHPSPKSFYVHTIGDPAFTAYRDHHHLTIHGNEGANGFMMCGERCSNYAFTQSVRSSFISNLLDGNDPFFELAGPLPPKKIQQSSLKTTIFQIAAIATPLLLAASAYLVL